MPGQGKQTMALAIRWLIKSRFAKFRELSESFSRNFAKFH
jgi:hypothetical protein